MGRFSEVSDECAVVNAKAGRIWCVFSILGPCILAGLDRKYVSYCGQATVRGTMLGLVLTECTWFPRHSSRNPINVCCTTTVLSVRCSLGCASFNVKQKPEKMFVSLSSR